jgi:hypothetical protein
VANKDRLAAVEQVPLGETEAMAAIASAAASRVRSAAAEDPPARRDAHPKPHGTVKAWFRVLPDIPGPLRAGVFRQPREFEAWIRFSNGAATPAPDAESDGRGMAIKLLDVSDSPSTTQDFLQINYPAFFVKDAADYVDFSRASTQFTFFFPSLNPFRWRLREALNGLRISRQHAPNPLNLRYFTMTPLLCGTVACKASSRPLPPLSTQTSTKGPNFMRANMAAHIATTPARFEFHLQAQTDPRSQPIEDPRIVWDETDAPFVPVAEITIPVQHFDTPEQDVFGENLSFTPWHCVPEHRPLGGINRVRRTVYETISALRHEMNQAERIEPAGAAGQDSITGRDAT